jgi:hypothetical protein
MSQNGLPSLLERHWAESALAIGAIIIAGVSLWVAFDTEQTNRELVASERQLVAANSWPFVEVGENDTTMGGGPGLSLIIMNSGIGPAKIETFELSWRGKPQHGPHELLLNCCVEPGQSHSGTAVSAQIDSILGVSSPSGVVMRAGQERPFLFLGRTQEDAAIIDALRAGLRNISIRYCYCSVFDECWLVTNDFGKRGDLYPPHVRVCPRPAVRYTNQS